MTRTGDQEIGVVSGRLPDNPGELACMTRGLRNRGEMTNYPSKYTQPVQWTKSIIDNTL